MVYLAFIELLLLARSLTIRIAMLLVQLRLGGWRDFASGFLPILRCGEGDTVIACCYLELSSKSLVVRSWLGG